MSKVTYKGPFRPGALASDPAGLLPGVYCPYDSTVDVPLAWLPSLLAGDWIAADAEAETYVPPAPEFYEEVYVSQSDGRLVDEERVDIFDPNSDARYLRTDGVRRTMRTTGDGKTGVLDFKHAATDGGFILHFTSDTAGSSGFLAAYGTDDRTPGAAGGQLMSQKTNQAAGYQNIAHPGAAILTYNQGYSKSWTEYSEIYKGNLGHAIYAKNGEGFTDGVATSGSTTFTSATANFQAGDVGATLRQTTSRTNADPLGTIPSGTTIVAVVNSTTVTLSAAATANATDLRFMVLGSSRAPDPVTQQLLGFYATDGTTALAQFLTGSFKVRYPTDLKSSDLATPALTVRGIASQTGETLTVLKDGVASGALSVTASGNTAARFGLVASNAAGLDRNPFTATNFAAAYHTAYLQGAPSQTGNQLLVVDSNSTTQFRLDKNGTIMTRRTAAPVDADLSTSEAAVWFDPTPGAAKLMVKAKNSSGTVVTGNIPLA